MGILNVAPYSFYDGGRYDTEAKIAAQAGKLLEDGAAIIDIGACSTRPGSAPPSEKEELERLLPAIAAVLKKFPEATLSADTFRSNVAQKAVEEGAAIINDISGGTMDEAMYETVAELQVPYVLVHIRGTPATMQENPQYDDVVKEISIYFAERIALLRRHGVNDIILDPGFGFGKTVEHNYEILSRLDCFKIFGLPVMAGLSRKSMLNKVLGTNPEEALNGTTVVNTIALMKGAGILRVHDAKEAREAVKIVSFLNKI